MTTLKKTFALASAATLTFTLVACGSDKKSEETATTTSAAATTTSAAAEPSATTEAPAPTTEVQPTTEEAQPEAAAPAPAQEAPAQSGNTAAAAADVAGIQETANAVFNFDVTVKDYFNGLIAHTCEEKRAQANIDTSMLNQIPDVKMKDTPQGANMPTFGGISNIQVNGSTATADVTVSAQGRTETQNVSFQKRGNTWVIC